MYKLMVIAGPNRGSSYPLQEGETVFGRQMGSTVVLTSVKVSKRHCCIIFSGTQLLIQDLGSSNGTFVNGALIKSKVLKSKDRISVGEYVFEVVETVRKKQIAAPIRLQSSQMPLNSLSMHSSIPTNMGSASIQGPPDSLIGKIIWIFENRIMPIFYRMNSKTEWRMMGIYIISILVLGNVVISIYPLLEENKNSIIKEVGKRAQFMARQIAEKNAPYLSTHAETKTEIGSVENAEGVKLAVLIDLENRIIAPSEKLNQYLASGAEARLAKKARDRFQEGREIGYWTVLNDSTLVAVEPVKVLSPSLGRNIIVAMAIVSLDITLSTPDVGEMGIVYSEAFIITGLFAALLFLIFYRITLKPFEILNEDLDRALKGEISQVTHEFKFEETNALWAVINSAIQRIPKNSDQNIGGGNFNESPPISINDLLAMFKSIGQIVKFGLVVFDENQKILYLNPFFEELSGIRADGALGQDMSSVARDQSLVAFTSDILGRAIVGNEAIFEEYDFSGTPFNIHAVAMGAIGGLAKGYLFAIMKNAES